MKNEQQRSRRDRKSGIWCLKIRVLIKLSRKLWPIPVRKILKTVGWLLWQTSWHLPQLTLWKTFCAMDPCPHYNGAYLFLSCIWILFVCFHRQHKLQIVFCSHHMSPSCYWNKAFISHKFQHSTTCQNDMIHSQEWFCEIQSSPWHCSSFNPKRCGLFGQLRRRGCPKWPYER